MGIIDNTPLGTEREDAGQALKEADAIFACVFLGFLDEGLQQGVPMRWDIDPATDDPKTEQQALQETLSRCAALLGRPDVVTAGRSPEYREGEDWHLAIAGDPDRSRDGSSRQSLQPQQPQVRALIEELVGDQALRETLDQERGAYYGLVDHPDNRPPGVISSVRRLIAYGEEGGRWDRDVPNHGLIGYERATSPEAQRQLRENSRKQAGSIEPTAMIRQWNGNDRVCGYCHGMTWAIAQVACEFEGGTPYELGLGCNTHKLASCFGCTTFLFANGYTPSSMHLGRGESWVPLPEGADAVAPFAASRESEQQHIETFRKLNTAWAERVAAWMRRGADLMTGSARTGFQDWAVAMAGALCSRIGPTRDDREVANLFLDALTVHARDAERIQHVLAPRPS